MNDVKGLFRGDLTDAQLAKFEHYFELLVEWNTRMNLTGIVERTEVYVKHFWDSLAVREFPEWAECVRASGRMIDVGTGAGFPGLPLAIVDPYVDVVLCDALAKRVDFLRHVVKALELVHVSVVHARAEDLARQRDFRNGFDVVVSRAVARMNVLLEYVSPFARPGGVVMAYKGPGVTEELLEAERAMRRLKARVRRTEVVELPLQMGERRIVIIEQVGATPGEYPRRSGIPERKPL